LFSPHVDTYRDLVSRKLIGYHQYLVDANNCKCALSWWRKEQNKFPTIAFVAWYILDIPTNHIEIESILSIASILTTL
jgi:hypothetical protein